MLSKGRRRWLERLTREGVIAQREGSWHCRDCMMRGWTCWAYRDRERGDIISEAELIARYGYDIARRHEVTEIVGEMITPAGRAALQG